MWERRDNNSTHPAGSYATEINSSAKIENTLVVLRPAVYCERRRFRKIVVKKLRRSFLNLTVRSVLRLILQPSPFAVAWREKRHEIYIYCGFHHHNWGTAWHFFFLLSPFSLHPFFFRQPTFLKCLTNPQKVYWNS